MFARLANNELERPKQVAQFYPRNFVFRKPNIDFMDCDEMANKS
jgi:hypothetical protein